MDIRRQLTCYRCRESVAVEKVKYIPKPNSQDFQVSCLQCLGEKKQLGSHTPKTIDESRKKVFFCGRCRYKFGFDMSKVQSTRLKCPMCGENDFLNEQVENSRQVLEEVSKPEFDEINIGVMRKNF